MEIVDQFGRPFAKSKTPDRRPLATAPIADSYREYVAAGLTPERLANIFKEADAGDMRRQAELFEQLEEKDAHLLGEKGKRQNAIIDVDFNVIPASDDARDVKVAEFVDDFLNNRTDFEDILVCMQDAVGKGYSCLEITWDVSSGQALPSDFEFIKHQRFSFMTPQGTVRNYPTLVTDTNPMGVDIPEWKVLFHRYGGKSGHPTRSGIYRVCAWMFLFKNYSLKDWVIFCEVFGMPLRLGKYDPGASDDDKTALAIAIRALGADAAGIISKSTEIEFLENKGTASAALYQNLASFTNREMSKAIIGQTLSAEVGDKGSYAAAKTHNEVRIDILRADSRAVAATTRHQLIRPIVGFNFGWDTAVPGYEVEWEEEQDLKAKVEWLGGMIDRGMNVPKSFVRSEFNIPEPKKGEECLGPAQPKPQIAAKAQESRQVAAKSANLASGASDEAGTAQLYTELAVDKASGLLSGMAEPIRELVMAAGSLEAIREGLLDLYVDEMDPIKLAALIQRAMTAAELAGIYEAKTDGAG